MPLKPFEIFFPTKGLDTNNVRLAQPDGTSPKMLNMMPFDRWGRRRGGTRSGTNKLTISPMGNGAQPVLSMLQVTRALDPSTITPSTMVLNEPFNYANGVQVGAIDSNPADGSADWRGSVGGASVFPFTTSASNALITQGATLIANGTVISTSAAGAAIYLPAINLGAAYIIKADAYVNTASSGGVGESLGLLARINTGSFAQDGFNFSCYNDKCTLRNANGSISSSFTFGSTLSSGFHSIELHFNGDSLAGFVDGVNYVTLSNTLNNTVSGFGVYIGGNKKTSGQGIKNFQVFIGAPLANYRQTNTIYSCGGNIYIADIATQPTIVGGGTGIVSTVIKTQMSSSQGLVYITDGVQALKVLDLSTTTAANIAVTAGTEVASTLGLYQLTCIWRDRLVLASSKAFPQNFVMSRQSTHTDFDYSQVDAAAAFAGNTGGGAGSIGEPLNALMPFSDDVLVLGGDHSIYKIEGDPAAGGSILLLSDSVGTFGADAWDSDSDGNVYFVGTGGFFKIAAGGATLENLSQGSIREFFININRVDQYVTCTWDTDRRGMYIHITDVNTPTNPPTHLFWDAAQNAFFPIQLPNTHGPITAMVYDGDGPADRVLLLGGRDGHIRKLDPTALLDDGTAIDSYVYIGPVIPYNDSTLGTLQHLSVLTGDTGDNAGDGIYNATDLKFDLTIQTGEDAYTALFTPASTVLLAGVTGIGRKKRFLQRVTGNAFYFRLENSAASKLVALEKLIADIIPAGMVRRY